ncbi:unnamed protein product [Dicrocoelium dendriticum]|nr:unnamed protein product [Dicrocoelium dendriticum]
MEIMSRATNVTPTLASVPLRFPIPEPNGSPNAMESTAPALTPPVAESPERSRSNSGTGTSVNQYGSPTSLPLPSLPNTPCSEWNRDTTTVAQRRASSLDYSEMQMASAKLRTDINADDEVHNKPRNAVSEGACAAALSPSLFNSGLMPAPDPDVAIEWARTLQQYMATSNEEAKSAKLITDRVGESSRTPRDPMDQLAKFQTMLTSMSHLLFSTQLPSMGKRPSTHEPISHMLSPNLLMDPAHFLHGTSSPAAQYATAKATGQLSMFTTPTSSQHGMCAPPSQAPLLSSLSDLQQSPTHMALTASLLAAVAAQRPAALPDPLLNVTDSFFSAYTQAPAAAAAHLPTHNSNQASTFVNQALGKFPNYNMPDNRDLLYELGKRLMAIASAPAQTDPAASQSSLSPLSTAEPRAISNPGLPGDGYSPPSAGHLFSNPMLAMMNAALFPGASTNQLPVHSSSNPSFPNGCSLPAASDNRPTSNVTYDRNIHSLSSGGTGLSGISMRGNQKYSAYYQHQRKQGIQLGNPNDFVNASSIRRQNSVAAFPMTNTRCGSRRLRSGFSNPTITPNGQESRVVQAPSRVRGNGGMTGGSMFSHFRGTPFKHSSTSNSFGSAPGLSKPQATSDDLMNSTTVPNSVPNETTPTSHRLRDTAFLCSCGKDFESLYIFTVHMKDTGHKPKSDQSERDIPKLVRGQDMWINSETEQTREILRCMRCHQSFRNLPELTMHMMKTNHYSEIVYNDSGRLVFVNPDEHRRGPATTTSSASSMNTSSSRQTAAISGQQSGRRNVKTSLNVPTSVKNWHSPLTDRHRRNRSGDDQVLDRQHGAIFQSDRMRSPLNSESRLSEQKGDTRRSAPQQMESLENNGSPEQLTDADGPLECAADRQEGESYLETCEQHSNSAPTSTKSPKRVTQDDVGCVDSSTDPHGNVVNSSVIRQIESFVESNLPRDSCETSTTKVVSSHTDTLQSSSPVPAITEGGVAHSSANSSSTHSPICSRKRTHSGASLSQHSSPIPSPLNESEGKSRRTISVKTDICYPVSVTSPVKVTSTSELSQQLTENPLSSLQKLVETTHKPIPPSSAFSSSGSSIPFLSCSSTLSSSRHPAIGRNSNAGNGCSNRVSYSPVSKLSTIVSAGPSTSAGSSVAQLLPPINKHDNLPPALSALYAYVENSSLSQSSETASRDGSHVLDPVDQIEVSEMSNPLTNLDANATSLNHPALQAFYAAAMSNLAAQYLNPLTANTMKVSTQDDPFQLFRQATLNFRDAFETSLQATNSPKPELASEWLKLLQLFGMQTGKFDSCGQTSPSECSEHSDTNNSVGRLGSPPQHCMRGGKPSGSDAGDCESTPHIRPKMVHHNNSTHSNFDTSYTPAPTLTASGHSPSSPPSSMINPGAFPSTLSSAQSGRFQSTMSSRPISSSGNTPTSLISTMITKKAKCHFCGKPFANKGQVRLHISKNKCPCLLQQSCHAAALAAAFGSDRRHTHTALVSAATSTYSTQVSSPVGSINAKNNKNMGFSAFSGTHNPEDTTEVPSAFSLLKERFQSFDLMQPGTTRSSGQRPLDSSQHNGAFSSVFTTVPSAIADGSLHIANFPFPPMTQSSEQWCGSTTPVSSISVTKDGVSSHSGNINVATATAAANASHLAAMALLAQTLVQLTSAQVPRPLSNVNVVEDVNFTPSRRLAPYPPCTIPNSSDLMGAFPLLNPGNINMELLLNQVNFARQLANIGWNDPSLVCGHKDTTGGLDSVDSYRTELAPNSLP